VTNKKLEEIKAIAFYQQAWGRFFYLRSELYRIEARAETAYAEIHPDIDETAQAAFIGIMTAKVRSEVEALSKTLEPEKYLK